MEQSKNKPVRKALRIAADCLLGLIIALGVLVSAVSLSARASGGVPSFFGHSVLVVQSESMTGTIDKGDIIFVDKFSADEEKRNLELAALVPDKSVVTFYFDLDSDGTDELVTHLYRGTTAHGNATFYVFEGTYNPDQATLESQYVSADKIFGLYGGTRIAKVGTALDFLRSPLGFGLLIMLPIGAFFIYALVRLILALVEARRPTVSADDLSEEAREQIRREILAELEAGKKDGTKEKNEK